MLSLTAANELIWKKFQHIEMGHEQVDILEGLDRIVAEDIVSPVDVPGFSRSMCDGYAVVASDTQGASEDNPVSLSYLGEVPRGKRGHGSKGGAVCLCFHRKYDTARC